MSVYKYKKNQGHIFGKGHHSRKGISRFFEGNFPPNYTISTLHTSKSNFHDSALIST